MKKLIIAFTLILAIVICLPSCGGNNYDADLKTLNSLADKDYSFFTIDIVVSNSNGSAAVKENYMVTEVNGTRTVKYHIERLNDFVIDGNNIYAPNGYTTVNEGTLSTSEAESNKYAVPSFEFSSTTLNVHSVTNKGTYSILNATVKSFDGFIQRDFEGSDAKVNVYYNSNQINSIEISFANASGSLTTITYTVQ